MRAVQNTQDSSVFDAPAQSFLALVVDDSRLQRRILSASLKRWGFETLEAESAEEALAVCADRFPDFVLSDWVMPGMDGLEFCKAFREISRERYGYFILLTSKSDKEEVAEGLDAGADDFLSKPVNSDELRARLKAGGRILEMKRELEQKNALISETLAELQGLYDSLDSDLIEAKKLQQSLLPERFKAFDTADLSLILRSSGHVGGDLVGFYPAGPDHIGLYALDVSGHGISSALMTARLAGYLSPSALDQNVALKRLPDGTYRSRPPAEVIADLNDLVLEEMETEHYFTLIIADVDLKTGRVVMAQAGHPHPAVQRGNGRIEQEGTGGFPVGLLSGIEFQESVWTLSPGDRLLILSDGVTECPNQDGTMLGEEGLVRLMQELRATKGLAFLETLLWKLSDFAGGGSFPDDVSGVLLEYRGEREK